MAAAPRPLGGDIDAPSWHGVQDLMLLEGRADASAQRKAASRGRRRPRGGADAKAQADQGPQEADAEVLEVASMENGGQEPPPWFALRDEPKQVWLRIHEELLDFASFLRLSSEEVAARQRWAAHIEAAAQSLWQGCTVHLCGSLATGFCLPLGSVNVSIVRIAGGLQETTLLKQLAECLLERGELARLELSQPPRVPKLRVQQRSTSLWADVTVQQTDCVQATRFASEQLQRYPALAPLVLLLKLFLLQRGLYDAAEGGLGPRALFCMVLFSLQRHPSARDAHLYATASLGELLFSFFQYFGREHDYASAGFSVLGSGCLFDRTARDWTSATRSGEPTLCIESPTNPEVDLGAHAYKASVIRAAFARAYHVLAAQHLVPPSQGISLLCPGLLRANHPIFVRRYEHIVDQRAKRRRLDPVRAALAEAVAQAIQLNEGSEVQDATEDVDIELVGPVDPLENVLDTLIAAEKEDPALLAAGDDTEDEEEVFDIPAETAGAEPEKQPLGNIGVDAATDSLAALAAKPPEVAGKQDSSEDSATEHSSQEDSVEETASCDEDEEEVEEEAEQVLKDIMAAVPAD